MTWLKITDAGTWHTCLVIKSVDANPANNANINNVCVQSKLASLPKEFPDIGAVNSSGYSKFALTWDGTSHQDQHCQASAQLRQAPVWRQKKVAQSEFKAMLARPGTVYDHILE